MNACVVHAVAVNRDGFRESLGLDVVTSEDGAAFSYRSPRRLESAAAASWTSASRTSLPSSARRASHLTAADSNFGESLLRVQHDERERVLEAHEAELPSGNLSPEALPALNRALERPCAVPCYVTNRFRMNESASVAR